MASYYNLSEDVGIQAFGKWKTKKHTRASIEKALDLYFSKGGQIQEKINKEGEKYKIRKITITGLALALGFKNRQSLYDNEKDKELGDYIHRARLFVENNAEMNLDGTGFNAAKFQLQNMGWKERSEIDNNINEQSINIVSFRDIETKKGKKKNDI